LHQNAKRPKLEFNESLSLCRLRKYFRNHSRASTDPHKFFVAPRTCNVIPGKIHQRKVQSGRPAGRTINHFPDTRTSVPVVSDRIYHIQRVETSPCASLRMLPRAACARALFPRRTQAIFRDNAITWHDFGWLTATAYNQTWRRKKPSEAKRIVVEHIIEFEKRKHRV